ncbi:MAG TPA: Crp/Fnr family transcriptional regulator [Deltaproteobacteria bacterium]|nr:Crp/Fnr family transcriptional regulator [Deltaproteobacteria bacterium]HQJ09066.1 Crp/Fnr family transcriptional regulator [Deltaproteobacteria bacterium]
MELKRILKDAFPSLSDGSLQMIARYCRLVEYPKNGILFLEGDKGNNFFYLASGTVKVYKTSPAGQETVLRLQGPGSIFAEVILFERNEYPVSAVTMAQSLVVHIPREPFLKLLDEERFRNEFIATLMHKQRYLTDRIIYLTSFDVEERFFRFLIEHYGIRSEYDIDMTKKDIASAIGTIPETLSRLIDRLKGRGIISWDSRTLKVKKDYLGQFTEESDLLED